MTEQPEKSPEEIRRDIEETREELGDTVDALSAKADVKGRAKGAVNEQMGKLREKQEELKQKVSGHGNSATAAEEQQPSMLDQLAARTREKPLQYLGAAAFVGLLLGSVMRGGK